MALSTTVKTAKDVVIKIDNEAGVLKDVSGSTNSVSISLTTETEPNRVFGSDWPIRTQAARDLTMDITALYSTAADEAADVFQTWFVNGGARTVEVYVPDSNAAAVKYSGEFYLEELSIDATAGDAAAMEISATIGVTGQPTIATVAS